MRPLLSPLLLLPLLAACGSRDDDVPAAADDPPAAAADAAPVAVAAPLIDPRSPKLVEDPANRRFTHVVRADLDADGTDERVVILANVGLDANLRPMWDDGQAWVAYVEEPDGARTYLFARYIQFGTLDLSLMAPGPDRTRTVVLIEDTSHSVGTYELRYRGPDQVELVRRTDEPVDSIAVDPLEQ